MAPGLFVRGYAGFLRRFLLGFAEGNPNRRRKKRRKVRRRERARVIRTQPQSKQRMRVRTTPIPKTSVKAGEIWQLQSNGNWTKVQDSMISISTPFSKCEKTQDFTNAGPPYVGGRPFTSVKVSLMPLTLNGYGTYQTAIPMNLGFGGGNKHHQYRGAFGNPIFTGVDYTDSQYRDQKFIFGDLSGFVPSMGPYHTLVDKMLRPNLSHANLGQSLVELREVPRMLQASAKDFHDYWRFIGGSASGNRMAPKGLSDSFLNAQFGWVPFINDITSVCDVILNAGEYIRDTTNRNNRWDHRKRVIEEKTWDDPIVSGDGSRISPSGFFWDSLAPVGASWTARYQYFKRHSIRVWASGDFKFYKPAFDMSRSDYDSGLNHLRRLSTLLGTDISPALLWKVTPWTWLSDWFINIGNVIESASAAGLDGVVSKNVFLMMTWQRDLILRQERNFASRAFVVEFRRIVESKQRGHAETPFNFGLLPKDLTGKQLAILGALGISRYH